jgi:hypothetical protein
MDNTNIKTDFRLWKKTVPNVYSFETVLKARVQTLTNVVTVFLQNIWYFADLLCVSNIRIYYTRYAHKLKVSFYHNLNQINSVNSKPPRWSSWSLGLFWGITYIGATHHDELRMNQFRSTTLRNILLRIWTKVFWKTEIKERHYFFMYIMKVIPTSIKVR